MDDVSCRIVVVSSSLSKGEDLVQTSSTLEIKQLSLSKSQPIVSKSAEEEERTKGTGSLVEPIFKPWTISNRYYNANVHFSLHTLSRVYPAVFEGVPALIVAWSKGEHIEELMRDLQQAMGGHEPEILLAVRLPGETESTSDSADSEDDIDSMLISYGFEYIDASTPLDPSQLRRRDDDDGTPHLPRVLDALSTFMWPSMTTNNDFNSQTSPTLPDARAVLRSQSTLEHIINRDPMAILHALEELDSEFNFNGDDSDSDEYHETLRELVSLEKGTKAETFADPLSFDDKINDDFLRTSSPTVFDDDDGFSSPNDLSKPFGISEGYLKPKISIGFEDDFSAFVTAPPEDGDVKKLGQGISHIELHSGRSSPDYDLLHSSDQSEFTQSGSLYRSLGSVSDLGDTDEPTTPTTASADK
ncbi:hypothetical protein FA15DRAFT_655477 [Coprinopsis marcescibilis]|uniref:Uncharacterized protein n=1 Tax=Coprinopsis marcescibilis TaxID=230819 RepID=A0A5C3KWW3_COPMA|nr:hypothetical protein FA15DRAFT_655477 [Coprinopsis marcescibilis]